MYLNFQVLLCLFQASPAVRTNPFAPLRPSPIGAAKCSACANRFVGAFFPCSTSHTVTVAISKGTGTRDFVVDLVVFLLAVVSATAAGDGTAGRGAGASAGASSA